MLNVYINYPNPRISVHHDDTCAQIGKQQKPHPRKVEITPASLSAELTKFGQGAYHFGANAAENDMWLEISHNDAASEMAVVKDIQRLLTEHHSPFGKIEIAIHC